VAFDVEPTINRIPTSVQTLTVTLQLSWETGATALTESAKFRIGILDQNGIEMNPRTGQLAPHCTAAELTALRNFMQNKWTQAQGVLG